MQNAEESTENLESTVEQVVDAEEIKQDPADKVQINGPTEFSFNVPISKYTSDTSEIQMTKEELPSA